MRAAARMTASAVVGTLVLLCLATLAVAQSTPDVRPVAHIASLASGSIQGIVQDERGELAGPEDPAAQGWQMSENCAGGWQRPGPASARRGS